MFRYATGVLRARAVRAMPRGAGARWPTTGASGATVIDLMRDPPNALPAELRAAIVSVGLAVQREMRSDRPEFRVPDRGQREHRRRAGARRLDPRR